jgi:hypothetical protein
VLYDTIIIGAGMSGTGGRHSAGVLRSACVHSRAALHHRRAELVLPAARPRLRRGLHAVTNFAPKGARKTGPLARLLKQLRFRWDDFALSEQVGSSIRFPGVELQFGNDFELLRSQVQESFPRQKENFERLLGRIVDYDDLDQEMFDRSTREILCETIDDPLLVEMLLCPLMWYGNAREDDMDFGQFCVMFRSIFLEGLARPRRACG